MNRLHARAFFDAYLKPLEDSVRAALLPPAAHPNVLELGMTSPVVSVVNAMASFNPKLLSSMHYYERYARNGLSFFVTLLFSLMLRLQQGDSGAPTRERAKAILLHSMGLVDGSIEASQLLFDKSAKWNSFGWYLVYARLAVGVVDLLYPAVEDGEIAPERKPGFDALDGFLRLGDAIVSTTQVVEKGSQVHEGPVSGAVVIASAHDEHMNPAVASQSAGKRKRDNVEPVAAIRDEFSQKCGVFLDKLEALITIHTNLGPMLRAEIEEVMLESSRVLPDRKWRRERMASLSSLSGKNRNRCYIVFVERNNCIWFVVDDAQGAKKRRITAPVAASGAVGMEIGR